MTPDRGCASGFLAASLRSSNASPVAHRLHGLTFCPSKASFTGMQKPSRPLFVFDFDGVLADSIQEFEAAAGHVCRALGYRFMADGREAFLRLFDDNFYKGLLDAGVPAERLDVMLERMRRQLSETVGRVKSFAGIKETLLELRRSGCRVCIVTSNLADVARDILAREGIDGITDISGAEQGLGKVERIKKLRERYRHTVAYYVGDTAGDMLEGRLAGAIPVAVTWGWHDRERLLARNPDHVVERPSDLLRLVAEDAGGYSRDFGNEDSGGAATLSAP